MCNKKVKVESSLPHDVAEGILEILPVKSLVRFKTVSKQWKSTIESRLFQERHLAHRQQSGDPDVLMVSAKLTEGSDTEPLATLTLGSSSAVKIPTPWTSSIEYFASSSIDGLVCLYNLPLTTDSGYVVNPATRWFRPIPLSRLQQLIMDLGDAYFKSEHQCLNLAFGKDIVRGTYKPVWLYNSSEIGLENATACEVFDFTTNAWRYVTPSAPCRILFGCSDPVFADGSLHWFAECEEETKIVSFDLHTETFHVLCKAPFAKAYLYQKVMCNLDNRLCVSLREARHQVIWSFHSGNKTWEKTFFINLIPTPECYGTIPKTCALSPLALLDADEKKKQKKKKKKKTLLFFYPGDKRNLVIQQLGRTSFDHVFTAEYMGEPICYFPSLISI